jgi:hypothetical protein
VTETVDQGPGASPPPATEPERKREIMGPTGLIVMVAAILLITAVAIIIQARANNGTRYHAAIDIGAPIRNDAVRVTFHVTNTGTKAGRPDVCEATLLDLRGARAGTAGVYLREPIQPGETFDVQAVGTVARPPVSGVVECRGMSPE